MVLCLYNFDFTNNAWCQCSCQNETFFHQILIPKKQLNVLQKNYSQELMGVLHFSIFFLIVRHVHHLSLLLLVREVEVSRDTKQLVEQSRGSREKLRSGHILTALPHGHANAAAASGLQSSVCHVWFIQFRGDGRICVLCLCCGKKYRLVPVGFLWG